MPGLNKAKRWIIQQHAEDWSDKRMDTEKRASDMNRPTAII